uniref:glycerophosphodiester phosphodiesterase n=1 Tax=Pyramimonas obovata TaxID=1411642 RepID=A0A7S0RPN6_9CHLO|mmetsp:Transcript_38597/g.83930  ORF Transcript_38597/g.83930 Transcript_38597/m.83930 type:complete len:324 (+) Transcript_38597:88-1059(+)|eukprot:CAMPEP_0118940798 /NCGR_PEP_ID=MMETSP1169-20130426/32345_1 /TAXON_ID=36882 /ORGANISM="Pyramimonas obovata, Strain CCMP722" /LENGTH=323 /DNA_ID=CAMNT_0006885389 /DNA_START=82 /DNA_END=1053 /DNA_ORIENTATION=-
MFTQRRGDAGRRPRRGGFRVSRPNFSVFAVLIGSVGIGTIYLSYQLLSGEDKDERSNMWILPEWLPSEAFCSRGSPPLICAHGGDTRGFHPNTVDAIRAVPATRAKCVEIDVSRTADDVLVASHGRDFASLLGVGSANIGHYTAKQVLGVDAGNNDHIPTFEDAIRAALETNVTMITVDTKPGPPREEQNFAGDVLSAMKRVGCTHRCQVWAKADTIVVETQGLDEAMQTGYVVMNQTEEARLEGMDLLGRIPGSQVVAVYYGMVDGAFVRSAHAISQQVHAWTVNDMLAMKQVLDAGVDAIVTNHPKEIQEAVDELLLRCPR